MRTWLALAAHYGEYILHPVELPCIVLDCQFDCGSFDSTKNKASVTPFHNVVHRPRGSSLLKEYHSQWGNSFCKSTKKKQLSQLFRNFFFFFFLFPPLSQRFFLHQKETKEQKQKGIPAHKKRSPRGFLLLLYSSCMFCA